MTKCFASGCGYRTRHEPRACSHWLSDAPRADRLDALFDRITCDPAVMGGRACVRGMRMTVSLVVNLVANGMSTQDIVREYPELEAEDIRQALQYAFRG